MPGDDYQPPPTGDGEPPQAPSSDASRRKAKWLIRLVATGCFLIGALDLGLYVFQSVHDRSGITLLRCLWLSIPLVAGVILLVKTSALADWIEDWLDQ
jgi:hypothetical protein